MGNNATKIQRDVYNFAWSRLSKVRFQLSIEDMNQKYYRRDGTSSCNHIFHWQLRRLQLMGPGAHQPGRKMTISFIIARSATFHWCWITSESCVRSQSQYRLQLIFGWHLMILAGLRIDTAAFSSTIYKERAVYEYLPSFLGSSIWGRHKTPCFKGCLQYITPLNTTLMVGLLWSFLLSSHA